MPVSYINVGIVAKPQMEVLRNTLYVFVCLSRVFLQSHSSELSDFLYAVRVPSKVKVSGVRFFQKKCFFQGFWGTKAKTSLKWSFSSFMKNQHGIFLIFHMKLQQHRNKLTQMTFFWTKSYQNGLRLRFFKY